MSVSLSYYNDTRAPTAVERADLSASILESMQGWPIVSTMDENMLQLIPAILYLIKHTVPVDSPPPEE